MHNRMGDCIRFVGPERLLEPLMSNELDNGPRTVDDNGPSSIVYHPTISPIALCYTHAILIARLSFQLFKLLQCQSLFP